MRIVIIILLIVLNFGNIFAQSFEKRFVPNEVHVSLGEHDFVKFNVVNRNSEQLLLWISNDATSGCNTDSIIASYFLSEHHGVKLKDIVSGIATSFSPMELEIGYNFVKLLEPHSEFMILTPPMDGNAYADFSRRIMVFPKKYVETILNQAINNCFLYSWDWIYIGIDEQTY